jgi:hypothetical protein
VGLLAREKKESDRWIDPGHTRHKQSRDRPRRRPAPPGHRARGRHRCPRVLLGIGHGRARCRLKPTTASARTTPAGRSARSGGLFSAPRTGPAAPRRAWGSESDGEGGTAPHRTTAQLAVTEHGGGSAAAASRSPPGGRWFTARVALAGPAGCIAPPRPGARTAAWARARTSATPRSTGAGPGRAVPCSGAVARACLLKITVVVELVRTGELAPFLLRRRAACMHA